MILHIRYTTCYNSFRMCESRRNRHGSCSKDGEKMKTNKKLLLIMCLSIVWMFSTVFASQAAEDRKNGWYYEVVESSGREGYRYYIDGELKVLSWRYNTETGAYYYLDAEGIMTTGWGEGYAEGYYFDSNGVIVTGWHYLMAAPSEIPYSTVRMTTNMVEASSPTEEAEYSGWYFFKSDGTMAVGWEKIDRNWFYFADSDMPNFCKGQMVRGKVSLEGNQYYFDEEDGKMHTGFVEYGGDMYYYSSVGMMKKNAWIKVGGNKYYADVDGKLYAGKGSSYLVKRIDGEVYAFDSDARMVKGKALYYVDDKWTSAKPSQPGDYSVYIFSSTGKGTADNYIVK